MSDLPKERVLESSKAFLNIAIDFMGPFLITFSRRRGQRSQKAYICIFVCLATKAIHLEVASDLSTPTFLDAFKRFLARRGPCLSVLSDHGTNFVGAKNALNELYSLLDSQEYKQSFSDELANHRITWHFTPPTGAHFNGISEANVKAVKAHLYKCIGNQILSLEELCTVSAQIEALLNSRPLCLLSSDPSEPSVLTPAHFLTQIPLESLPASDVTNENPNRLTRYKLLDQIVQTFWKRWSSECLHDLQLREKWNTSSSPLIPGQIVLIKQDNVPPLHWFSTIKQHALCVNCLTGAHKVSECKSKSNCSNCKVKHNTLLCFKNKVSFSVKVGPGELKGHGSESRSSRNTGPEESESFSPPTPHSPSVSVLCSDDNHVLSSSHNNSGSTVLLSTVKVLIPDNNGHYHPLRFILDSGSQSNLILESTRKKLGLPLNKDATTTIKGIGMGSNPVNGQVNFTITSRLDSRIKYSINALVVDKIIDMLPSQPVDMSHLKYLEQLPLADDFMKPDIVSGILGAQIFPSLILGDRVTSSTNNVVALNTVLGYVVMGQAPLCSVDDSTSNTFCVFQDPPIDNLLKRFWEIETVAAPAMLNDEDKKCEELYSSSVHRNDDGSYTVSLPFKGSPDELGDSYHSARNRFFSLERKLQSNPELRSGYNKVIQENIDEGYLSVAVDQSDRSGFFIPHHMVVRPDKASSKLRCVFDASMQSSSSKSLNDLLFTGPKLYTDLFVILLNFRLFPVVMVADIRKMFLQIKLNPDDWKYQKILWRFHPDDQLLSHVLTTVTFGLRCSPFLALRTVKQLAMDEANNFPLAASKVETDLYMDDLATSVFNADEACVLFEQMVGLFKAGGFTLTKWATNSGEVLQEIPVADRLSEIVQWDADSSVKILGLQWSADRDIFYFKINIDNKPCTKRNMLSLISRLFDPLGLLAPVILWAKQLIQQLWCLNLSWDETPPPHIVEDWEAFQSQLPLLSDLSFPRHLFVVENCTLQIFGFGDASVKGFGGVVYSRVVFPNGDIKVNLICAKSKVAPVKSQSIPRLELCAALLLAQLVQTVVDSYTLRFPIEKVLCFSDSTVVLSWIHASPHVWETFVANRVSKIQESVDITAWWKISGTDNPADCLSRGLKPAENLNRNGLFVPSPLKTRLSFLRQNPSS
ncbi:uncharacterized protein LOC103512836 [Diaphorina citri]|uniref:Uncharacterized protein LOC103512836 n=1 Tax=Diaphorina citri TaxID=121845 RepID=A0A3Q0J0P0_DIACI|nr:uncharacterized protein LOC103512836 [Diaphorina citri]